MRAWLHLLAGVLLSTIAATAQCAPAYVYSGALLPLLVQAPSNGWVKVSLNRFSDVWTSPDLEPLYYETAPALPTHIISAWSGFAWDSNRGDLILYGGGHANYPGNDVYRWHSSNLQWVESEATWTQSRAGVPWSAPGAAAAGVDYDNSADALVAAPYAPGWVAFDVTARVRQWAGGSANYGWRMSQTTSGYFPKTFDASEYATDPTLRPKLAVVYSTPN